MSKTIDAVCVVDDDIVYQFTTKKLIQHTKLVDKILVFSDGEKAIEFFQSLDSTPENTPDIVLLDINMPIMDGWDFLKAYVLVKPRLPKKVTIYLVSSSVHGIDIERAKQISDVTDYIIKPVTKDKLVEIFQDYLETNN
jgi:CheY-like chemotaxis protein